MTIFLRLVAVLAKYGSRAVSYAWANKGTILRLIERGFSISYLVQWVRDHI